LGQLYQNGEDVSRNETIALNYFTEAAQTNYSDALFHYGMALMSLSRNENEKGAQLITTAASQGNPLALYHIGNFLSTL